MSLKGPPSYIYIIALHGCLVENSDRGLAGPKGYHGAAVGFHQWIYLVHSFGRHLHIDLRYLTWRRLHHLMSFEVIL